MNYSKYQNDIFEFARNSTENAIVEAVAGSGKTTTMEAAIRMFPCDQILACAFNKHIADSLAKRMPSNVMSATLSRLGFRKALSHFKGIKLDKDKVDNILKHKVLKLDWDDKASVKAYYKIKSFVGQIIHLMRNLNISDGWLEAADRYGLVIPAYKNLETIVNDVYTRVVNDKRTMDFTDQVFYPVHYEMEMPAYDQIWVDETQDLNPIQIALIKRMRGRVVAVGDTHQAIYGFRGADPYAMSSMKSEFNMTELPLSICYRCPKNVVREAQKLVPHIEWSDSAEDGVVDTVKNLDNVQDTDWVLCRTTEPVVQSCLKIIASGRKATVKGRDIGDNIIKLLDEISDPCTITELGPKVQDYRVKKVESLQASGRDTQEIEDRIETLLALMEGASTSEEVEGKVREIFSDDAVGITHATIHRSKGLEANTVWILRPDLLPHPSAKLEWQKMQEKNLQYVAITRAMKNLFYVES